MQPPPVPRYIVPPKFNILLNTMFSKEPLGRPRRRCVDNIRMDLQEVDMWTGLGWLRIGTGGGRL